ncbi:50S ribosomal protein L23 [Teredinibacter turnerae]|uniref:Large ribosomal subunit protein uL23 n=1 Tax=Teredinibacter turnerae (strain ATCC 39867 / T7901) TaxID=377629 RepID=RL23_TERTT|nr:50S ribosomal protein L23 [Teredinibacter turnerae]C5BQ63.1 RecName: Full=Large ribosomal subunit protein uL23; AltName: Full=50S ribosomal protein L23 [Teredinibacter turnerae T7901]ACR13209.1 ribosomal protein L23 [Teredinibacter turnerae T7901]
MNQERLYKVLLGPVISEKAAMAAEIANQAVFKVVSDASKSEIKAAVEKLFNVSVEGVRVLNVKGKTKRTRYGMGRRSDWKKAYVTLAEGSEIDFESGE